MEKQSLQLTPDLHPIQNKNQIRQLLRNERVHEYHSFFAQMEEVLHFGQHNQPINNCNKDLEFNNMTNDCNLRTIIKEKLQCQGIKESTSGKFEPFNFRILKSSINFEIVQAQLKWGYNQLEVKILNSRQTSIFHSRKCSKGCNGTVYYVEDQARCFAVKCNFIKSDQEEIKTDLKVRALQEYFISKMASALDCGPKIINYAGFDLFFNEDCIQFTLQQCFEPQKVSSKIIAELKQSLKLLHQSRIVHFDIKNQNIMWSKSLKRLVFIDFGLSQLIDGGPEFKYPCVFKGTLNYCSKQMAAAFESNQVESIDIYYNDVACLSSSINKYRNLIQLQEENTQCSNVIAVSQSKYDQYVEEYVKNIVYITNDNSFLVELKIIMLKYYIYIKNSKEIDTIYNQSDEINGLIFSSKILSFIKEVLSAKQMKQFYRKYISKYIRDTVDYGWVQKWSKGIFSTLNYQQKISPQTRNIYQSYYLQIVKESDLRKQLFNSLSKVQIMSMLMQNQIENKQIYFYLFVSYISYINNRYDVQEKERNEVIQHFNRIFAPSALKQKIQLPQNKQVSWSIFEKLSNIFQYILSFYFTTTPNNHCLQMDSTTRMQMILQIIEHIFFFALLPTPIVIQILSSIYSLSIWSVAQKLQIIVRIILINDWNLAPLFKRKSISLKAVQLWIQNHLKQLYFLETQSSSINQILRSLKRPVNQFDGPIIIPQYVLKTFSSNFKFYLQSIQFSKKLVHCNAQTLIKINMQIQQITPLSLQGRPFPIHFILFSLFQSKVNNLHGCRSILNLIQRNIRSMCLSSNLILQNIINILQNPIIQVLLKQVSLLLRNIGIQNIAFFFVLIYDSIHSILNFMTKNPTFYFRYESQYNDFKRQLQNLVDRLDYKRIPEDHIEKCSLRQQSHYYFDMKLIYNRFSNKTWSFIDEINFLQRQRRRQDCQSCFAGMTSQLQRLLRDYRLNQSLKLPQSQLIQFYRQTKQLSNKIQSVNRHNCADESLKKLSLSTSFAIIKSMIIQDNITTQLLQVIYQFLQELKQDHELQSYYINYDSCPRMIQFTLVSIQYKNGVLSMALFIKKLLKTWRLIEQPQSLQYLINSFNNLINNHVNIGTQEKLTMILQQLEKQQEYFPQVITFYYSYLIVTKEEKSKFVYLIKIFQLLENLPHKIAVFFQAKLYYLLLYAQKALFSNVVKHSCEDNIRYYQKKLIKKTNWLKKQLIKIARSLPIFLRISKKQKKTGNLKITKLHNKCNCMGTYKIDSQQSFHLLLIPKIR